MQVRAGAERMRTAWSVAARMGVIVAALELGTWSLVRSIAPPLKALVGEAKRIGNGDLSGRMDSRRKDGIGEVQRARSRMKGALNRIVREVRESTESIQTASAGIVSGTLDLSHRTEQTASNLLQAAGATCQLTGRVSHSADSAATAKQLAGSAAEDAQRGGAVQGPVASTMEEINASVNRVSGIVGEISASTVEQSAAESLQEQASRLAELVIDFRRARSGR
ncbi:hypothetical protein H5407_18615 [Mitsuaria sp. WAJ17]|uniref:hypothetical protein n=1 Tax=Mitsuaria sp. WAJ17 TaxID=2761452 RepID=UPI0016019290|nr:hypothetical protein [Mitsuaria sp. WAJ17]MBB2487251.1 hypothetical protein [Mitsuaria sp. WAJ17]